MAMMVEQEQDTVLPFQCPDGCTVVYYIKQLSPSDAACSKQIKLPKTEARSFVGDLRHKQRSLVAVLDHQHIWWEFLCTCYGCQYALSRVAVFCNTHQLRAGQYLMFYRDALKRLRISVSSDVPDILHQHFSIGSRGPLQRTLSQISPPTQPALLPPAAAAAEPNSAVAPAAAYSTAYADQNQIMYSNQITLSPSRDSNLSTDDLRRSSSSGVDSDHSLPGSQASRDSCSDHLAAVAAAAVDSCMYDSRSWQGQGVIANAAASCSSRQQLQQLAPAAIFGGASAATAAELQQQLMILQASSGLASAPLAPWQQQQQQDLCNPGGAAAAAAMSSSGQSPIQCTLVCHEQLLESPTKMFSRVWCPPKHRQRQRDQSRSKPNQKVAASTAAAADAATAVGLSAAAAAVYPVATSLSATTQGTGWKTLNQPHHQQQFSFRATKVPKSVLKLGAAAAEPSTAATSAATAPFTAAAAAATSPACGSKRSVRRMCESFTEIATKRQRVSGHAQAPAAAAVTNAAATYNINTTTNVSSDNNQVLHPGWYSVWPADTTGSKLAAAANSSNTSSRTACVNSTKGKQADGIGVQASQISGGYDDGAAVQAAAALTGTKAPLTQDYDYCNVSNPVGCAPGQQPSSYAIRCGTTTSNSSRSCFAGNACSGSGCLPSGGYGSYLPAYTGWQPPPRQQQQLRAAAAGATGSCSERVFHTGMWQQQQMLWANICAHYGGSSGNKNVITAGQVLPLFQTAACGTAAAAAGADVDYVETQQYGPRAQSKNATAMIASAAARSARAAITSLSAAAAAASAAAAAWTGSDAAAGAAAPRVVPPKQLYKPQKHKLLQQDERLYARQGHRCAQILQQQQQLDINLANDQISAAAAAAAAAADNHGSEWSAVCGLLMLSQN